MQELDHYNRVVTFIFKCNGKLPSITFDNQRFSDKILKTYTMGSSDRSTLSKVVRALLDFSISNTAGNHN